MEGGREGFNLLYASESDALIVPLCGSCHLFLFSFLTTLLCSNKSKANRQYGLASVIGIFVFIVVASFSLILYGKTNAVKNEGDFQ